MGGNTPYRGQVYPPYRLRGIKRSIGSLSAPPLNKYQAVPLTSLEWRPRRDLNPCYRRERAT